MTIHAAMVPQEKTQQHVRVLGMPSRALTPHAKSRALAPHAPTTHNRQQWYLYLPQQIQGGHPTR